MTLEAGRQLLGQLREAAAKIFPLDEIPERHPRNNLEREAWPASRYGPALRRCLVQAGRGGRAGQGRLPPPP